MGTVLCFQMVEAENRPHASFLKLLECEQLFYMWIRFVSIYQIVDFAIFPNSCESQIRKHFNEGMKEREIPDSVIKV